MSRINVSVGDRVWVPSHRLHESRQQFALTSRSVLEVQDRSVVVDDGSGTSQSVKIATRQVHSDSLGFLVLAIGDLETEETLTRPLAKSALQYLRLLLPDDVIDSASLRTRTELTALFRRNGAQYSHVVLVGHGSKTDIPLLDGRVTGAELGDLLNHGEPKAILSLSCYTGQMPFARPLSQGRGCRELVAPFGLLHGAAASLFFQAFLHQHLLHGEGVKAAFGHAQVAAEGTHFRHWRNGNKQ
ncbi:MAG: hypothetical protein ACTMHL_12445 [Janibacter sp.]